MQALLAGYLGHLDLDMVQEAAAEEGHTAAALPQAPQAGTAHPASLSLSGRRQP